MKVFFKAKKIALIILVFCISHRLTGFNEEWVYQKRANLFITLASNLVCIGSVSHFMTSLDTKNPTKIALYKKLRGTCALAFPCSIILSNYYSRKSTEAAYQKAMMIRPGNITDPDSSIDVYGKS